jgi:CubicO group peptidase (beta-lactamase class C family)
MRAVAIAMLAGMMLCAQGATAVDDVTRAALANRVEGGHTVGVEVGLATTEGRAFAVHGLIAKGGTAPTKDTVFEIGSITKVFTAGRPITLADLTTHASGLPRLPTNLETASLDNPTRRTTLRNSMRFFRGIN